MKILLLIFAIVLFIPKTSLALSDEDHKAFLKVSSEYKNTDEYLTSLWSKLKRYLPKKEYKIILKEQINWIKYDRDRIAKIFMDNGYDTIEAYTYTTSLRCDELLYFYEKYAKKDNI